MTEAGTLASADPALIAAALDTRPSRPPDFVAEANAVRDLAAILAARPQDVLRALADRLVADGLAPAAGVALFDAPTGELRIEAAAGALAADAAALQACRLAVERGAAQLLVAPRGHGRDAPAVAELLAVPFENDGAPAGAVWLAACGATRRFEPEDARRLAALAPFAAAGKRMARALAAEDRLRERERRLAAIFETAPVGLSEIAPDGRFLRVNAELCRMLGRSEAELLGLGVADVTAPADLAPSLAIVGGVLASGEPAGLDKRYLRSDGGMVWANSRASRLESEGGAHLLVATVDLTARRFAESALRTSEERLAAEEDRLRLALEVGKLATWDWDPVSGAVAWNDEHYRMQGYAVGEVPPSFDNWAARVHPEDLAETAAAIEHARATRTDYAHEFRNLLPDGTVRWCSARGRFFYDADGTAVRMIGVMEDVTEARAAQAALAESERRLRVMLAELQHRVRNTLGIIRSIARRTAETSATVDDMAAHLAGRIEAFSRVQGAVTRDPSSGVDLTGLIEDELLAHATREGPQLSLRGPRLLLAPRAAESISLAIHELATNAVKHGALSDGQGRIDIRWSVDGERLSFSWKEYGLARPLDQPERDGFGMELLLRSLPYDLGAETAVTFEPGGMRFTLSAPAAELLL